MKYNPFQDVFIDSIQVTFNGNAALSNVDGEGLCTVEIDVVLALLQPM